MLELKKEIKIEEHEERQIPKEYTLKGSRPKYKGMTLYSWHPDKPSEINIVKMTVEPCIPNEVLGKMEASFIPVRESTNPVRYRVEGYTDGHYYGWAINMRNAIKKFSKVGYKPEKS